MMANNNKRNKNVGGNQARKRNAIDAAASNDRVKRQQPKKDSNSKRVNLDNERVSRYDKSKAALMDEVYKGRSTKGRNDVAWYSGNPELLRAAASFPFLPVLGTKPFSSADSTFRVPGVMRLKFAYAFGSPNVTSSDYANVSQYPIAINQAAKSVYSFLVHANSRNYTYEYQDLMMVIMAGAQVFAALSTVTRAYGISKTYAENSLYKPDALLTGMGFDPDDFRENLSRIWFDINNLIAQTSQIWIPNTFPVIQRWFWLSANLYQDAETWTPQLYFFQPAFFLQYNETATTEGGGLEPATYNANPAAAAKDYAVFNALQPHSWQDWKDLIQHMIDRLVNSEDRGIIMGDILNAYGADKIYAMPSIPSDYRVEPVYNAEVLTQIENYVGTGLLTSNNTPSGSFPVGLRQTPDGLAPVWYGATSLAAGSVSSANACPNEVVINFHQLAQPTPEQIVVATRLTGSGMVAIKYTSYFFNDPGSTESASSLKNSSGEIHLLPRTCGSEVGLGIDLIGYTPGETTEWTISGLQLNWGVGTNNTNPSSANTMLLQTFDWHPFIYRCITQSAGTTLAVGDAGESTISAFGDYENYSVVPSIMLERLHQTALMSEFGVPQM